MIHCKMIMHVNIFVPLSRVCKQGLWKMIEVDVYIFFCPTKIFEYNWAMHAFDSKRKDARYLVSY